MKPLIATAWMSGNLRCLALALVLVGLAGARGAVAKPPAASPSLDISTVSSAEDGPTKITLNLNGKIVTATIMDNATSRDFIALLPMSLKLEDYASTEKIAYLPRKLSTKGAPEGIDPEIGDLTYYAPWGNLAIFYRDFGYSTGLVRLGHIDTDTNALSVSGSLEVTIDVLR